eukprot:TRINITY_DN325_c0_g1_i1.p1 TRINITY_DN325_c0_g1~~TRINITY_DN325_c0_g1_i1.p1  ORF type:complete len:568 (-),score=291.62 TRINITY_DN325_c0_g1_i1:168-1805(-)
MPPMDAKPLSGGGSGMSWADFQKQMEEEDARNGVSSAPSEAPKPAVKKSGVKKAAVAAKKASAAPLDPEEEEKKRLREEEAVRRRQEMKEMMAKKKAEKSEETEKEPEILSAPSASSSSVEVSSVPSVAPEANAVTEEAPAVVSKKIPAPKALSEEEEEKKKAREELALKRRQEMREMMNQKKTESKDSAEDPFATAVSSSSSLPAIENLSISQPSSSIDSGKSFKQNPEEDSKHTKRNAALEEMMNRHRKEQSNSFSSSMDDMSSSSSASSVLKTAIQIPLPTSPIPTLAKSSIQSSFAPVVQLQQAPPKKALRNEEQVRATLHSFKQPTLNFLDDIKVPVADPKYSKKELANIQKMVGEQAREETETLFWKLSAMQRKCQQETAERDRIRQLLSTYESALVALPQALSTLEETKRKAVESERNFNQGKVTYEHTKKEMEGLSLSENTMRERLHQIKQSSVMLRNQYETIKKQANDILGKSNEQRATITQQHELLMFVIGAKISKTAAKGQSVKGRVDILDQENAQLLRLAEDLMSKMDSLNTN